MLNIREMENQKESVKKQENEMEERANMQPFNSIHSQEGADDSEGEQNKSQGEHLQEQPEGVQGNAKEK